MIPDLKGVVTAGNFDGLFRLDFYRISLKNRALDWLLIAVINGSGINNWGGSSSYFAPIHRQHILLKRNTLILRIKLVIIIDYQHATV
jgi:hypothetical protein